MIEVTDNQFEGQLTTLGRYLLTAGGSYALGKGWIDGELLQLLTGLVAVVAPIVWGIYKTWTNKKQTIVLADAAPSKVAQVVSK